MTWIDDGREDTKSYRQSIAVSYAKREWGEHTIKAKSRVEVGRKSHARQDEASMQRVTR